MLQALAYRGVGRRSREEATGGKVRKHEQPDVGAVVACDHDVLNHVAEMCEQRRAERPDPDPGAGRQLEVLRKPSAENEASREVRRIDRLDGVAHRIEPVLVKGRVRQRGVAPVAGRDIRAAHAGLE